MRTFAVDPIVVAFLLCPLAAVFAYRRWPPHRAALLLYFGGWMFLPVATLAAEGGPDLDKPTVLALSALLGLVSAPRHLRRFNPSVSDLVMALWCTYPFLVGGLNGLGYYEGLSASLQRAFVYAAPYCLGRLYFEDKEARRELCWSLVLGGLIYLPFCCLELFNGPFLHEALYGFHQHDLGQHQRFGGWRAMVFMQHGLMVSLWLAAAALCAFRLRKTEVARAQQLGASGSLLSVVLVLQKSLNGIVLAGLGLLTLVLGKTRTSQPTRWALLLAIPTYLILRLTLVVQVAALEPKLRAALPSKSASLAYRMGNEEALIRKVKPQFFIGWGRGDHWRPPNPYKEEILAVTDSLWIIILAESGCLGLVLFYGAFLLPVAAALKQPDDDIELLGVLVLLYLYDSMLNGMVNPAFHLCLGSVAAARSE